MSRTPYRSYTSPIRASRQKVKGKAPRVRRRGLLASILVAQPDLPPGPTRQCRVCLARIRSTALHIGTRPEAHIVTFTVPE